MTPTPVFVPGFLERVERNLELDLVDLPLSFPSARIADLTPGHPAGDAATWAFGTDSALIAQPEARTPAQRNVGCGFVVRRTIQTVDDSAAACSIGARDPAATWPIGAPNPCSIIRSGSAGVSVS